MKSITRISRRAAILGAIAGVGLLATTAFAMQGHEGCPPEKGERSTMQQRGDGFAERRAARMAELKARLKITPAQEAAWMAFADFEKPMMDKTAREDMRATMQGLTTPERLERMQAMAEQRQALMKQRVATVKSLYAQLDPEQQKAFDDSMSRMMDHERGEHGHGERGGH